MLDVIMFWVLLTAQLVLMYAPWMLLAIYFSTKWAVSGLPYEARTTVVDWVCEDSHTWFGGRLKLPYNRHDDGFWWVLGSGVYWVILLLITCVVAEGEDEPILPITTFIEFNTALPEVLAPALSGLGIPILFLLGIRLSVKWVYKAIMFKQEVDKHMADKEIHK